MKTFNVTFELLELKNKKALKLFRHTAPRKTVNKTVEAETFREAREMIRAEYGANATNITITEGGK